MADEGDTSSYTCCMTCGGTFTSTRVGVCVGLPPPTHTPHTHAGGRDVGWLSILSHNGSD